MMTPYSIGSVLSYKNTSAESEDQDLVLNELRSEPTPAGSSFRARCRKFNLALIDL